MRRARASEAEWTSSSVGARGRTPAESSRETRGPRLKGLLRAREKIPMDRDGERATYETSPAPRSWRDGGELRTLGDELAALETPGTVRVVQVKNGFVGVPRRLEQLPTF